MAKAASPSADGAGPGAALRKARTDLRMSVEEVARELNLSPRHIAALEGDDYQSLAGAAYVRGYLRRYARLLGLPPEPLLDAFNRLPMAAQRTDLVAPAPVRQITSNDSLIKLGTLLVVGVMVGLAVIWWQGQERVPPPSDPAVPPVVLAPEIPTAETNAPVSEEVPTPPPRVEPAPAPAEPPTTEARAGADAEAAAVDIDPNAPRVRLKLYVMDESWADVRDAYQRRLIYETVAAGRVVTLEGAAPLSVFLGNVDGVRVELDGRAYDALRHKRGQVARFTVSQTGGVDR